MISQGMPAPLGRATAARVQCSDAPPRLRVSASATAPLGRAPSSQIACLKLSLLQLGSFFSFLAWHLRAPAAPGAVCLRAPALRRCRGASTAHLARPARARPAWLAPRLAEQHGRRGG